MATVTLTLPDDLVALATRSGLFEPARFEQTIRALLDEEDELRAMIREGDESGPSIPAEQVYAELRAMFSSQGDRDA